MDQNLINNLRRILHQTELELSKLSLSSFKGNFTLTGPDAEKELLPFVGYQNLTSAGIHLKNASIHLLSCGILVNLNATDHSAYFAYYQVDYITDNSGNVIWGAISPDKVVFN